MSHALMQAGKLVDDHWRLERQISAGISSSVWVAEHCRLEGRVAIKFLLDQLAADANAQERFLREAQAVCKVRSPHVVQVLDRGIVEGVPYLVMELLEGEDLGRLLARERMLGLSEVASMLDQLCRGLTKVHSAGYVHRDIKPENVFVIHESDGGHFVKLLDFGVAKQVASRNHTLTQDGTILGTAHYLSPEQIERPREVDGRADVWAVGVLGYRMLTGKLPFEGDSWVQLCERILTGKFIAASAERATLPAILDDWFASVLARDREERFHDAQAASAALSRIARAHASGKLEQLASGELWTLKVAPASGRTRQKWTAWLALAALLAASAALWVSLRRGPVGAALHPVASMVLPAPIVAQPAAAAPIIHTEPDPVNAPSLPSGVDAVPLHVAPTVVVEQKTPAPRVRRRTSAPKEQTIVTHPPKDRGF